MATHVLNFDEGSLFISGVPWGVETFADHGNFDVREPMITKKLPNIKVNRTTLEKSSAFFFSNLKNVECNGREAMVTKKLPRYRSTGS